MAGTPCKSRDKRNLGCRTEHSTQRTRYVYHFLDTKTRLNTDFYSEPMSFWHIFLQPGHRVALVPGRTRKDRKASGRGSASIRGSWRQTLLLGREEG